MIIYTNQKSKKSKPSAKKRELANSWQELLKSFEPKKPIKSFNNKVKIIPSYSVPAGRETPKYPSLNSGQYDCYKKEFFHYTGDKMKGIGTLHKSNAVPIFTDEEAKDQANMRR